MYDCFDQQSGVRKYLMTHVSPAYMYNDSAHLDVPDHLGLHHPSGVRVTTVAQF